MDCSNCKTANQEGTFCTFCGAELTAEVKPVETLTPINQNTVTSTDESVPTPNQLSSDDISSSVTKINDAGTESSNETFAEVVDIIISQPQSAKTETKPVEQVQTTPHLSSTPQTSTTAIAALISVFFIPLLGLILGYLARKEIRNSLGSKTGLGIAMASIVIGWVFVGFGALFTLLIIVAALYS